LWPLLVLIPIILVLLLLRSVLGCVKAAAILGLEKDGVA